MQQPDYDYTSSNYHQYPHHHQPPPHLPPYPTTTDHPPSYASAPPFSSVDFDSSSSSSSFSHNYPPFPHTYESDPQPPFLAPQYYQTPTYPNANPNPNPNPCYYDNNNPNYGHNYYDENLSGSNLGGGPGYDYDYDKDGVYPYEPRGTASNWTGLFDDYGRPIRFPSSDSFKDNDKDKDKDKPSSFKVVKAVPKADPNSDFQTSVQKFRVQLLPESGAQSVLDVLCMVGLDGIRMLDPNTNRTLRIYPLESVTRCDKYDSSTVAFWSKTSVDVEPKRIRLQSNSYTTNTILDTVTAAIVQFKEMGGNVRPSEPPKALEQSADKKKGLTEWISKLKPVNEEKDHWVPDEAVSKCTGCGSDFNAFNRRHHCRNCGDVFCDKCTQGRTPLTAEDDAQAVRVCDRCMAHVTDRLSRAKEAATQSASLQSHEDLAKKLQEEMEKNLRISSGSRSEVSGRQMREVACPTCTVHLQVQVPISGSETIECGVCQHPFLVTAH